MVVVAMYFKIVIKAPNGVLQYCGCNPICNSIYVRYKSEHKHTICNCCSQELNRNFYSGLLLYAISM